MARPPQTVTDSELAILQVLWDRGSATVRDLSGQLYGRSAASQQAASQQATVQKLLERLEGKGCVRRDRGTWPHTFHPTIDRQDLIGRQLQQTADKLCDGSLQPLLSHLVKAVKLTPQDRQSLRELLEELNDQNQRKGKK